MNRPLLSKEQLATGYDRYLRRHSEARARVNAITQEHANSLGVGLEELRRVEVEMALSESAKSLGIDRFEYLLRFAVDTESEREQIRQASRESLERAIGLR